MLITVLVLAVGGWVAVDSHNVVADCRAAPDSEILSRLNEAVLASDLAPRSLWRELAPEPGGPSYDRITDAWDVTFRLIGNDGKPIGRYFGTVKCGGMGGVEFSIDQTFKGRRP
ncbi:hypothetical protein [Inquilinus limosus]|uniref:hypothetical protein n=1 Tax=Inquilinus limosus TaxID=171674 RepID=UPI001269CDF7|nr:hypothetical protein [Inquilinus limosus]